PHTIKSVSLVTLSRSPHISYHRFFFSLLRRPPRSTLFPSRRSSDLAPTSASSSSLGIRLWEIVPIDSNAFGALLAGSVEGLDKRSEEHTSELQSPYDLVCRLLLEKKKNEQTREHPANTKMTMCITDR